MEGGKVLGLVTRFDFFRTFAFTSSQIVPHYDDLMSRRVEDVMTEAIVHVEPKLPLTRVLQLMVNLKMRSFPVMTPDRQLLGIILREDGHARSQGDNNCPLATNLPTALVLRTSANWAKEETMSVVLSRRSVTTAAMFCLAADMGLSSVPGGAQGVKPMQSPITGNEDLGE